MRSFFTNKDVNRIFLHKFLFNIAERIGWIFGPIFLLQQGYSLPLTLVIWSGIFAIRLPMRYLYLRGLRFFGLVRGVCVGLVFYAAAFLFLPHLKENPDYLPWFILLIGIAMTFYYTAFHTLFGVMGDKQDRGKHVAMLNTISMMLGALIPLLSAILVAKTSYYVLFSLSSLIMVAACVPLIGMQAPVPVYHKNHNATQRAACRWIAEFHFFYAIKEYAHAFLWRIIVFTMVGSLLMFGTILTAGLVIFAIIQLFAGSWVDKGKGYLLMKLGVIISVIQVLIRAFIPAVPAAMAATESLSVGGQLMAQADANFYNRGKDTDNYFYYIYWAEASWDGTVMMILLLMAGMVYVGLSLQMIMLLLAPIGLVGLYWINGKAPKH